MFYNKSIKEIEKELNTKNTGLTTSEVNKRIKKYGKNTLPKKKKDSVLKIFFNEFKNPIIILLLFAVLASLFVNEVVDAIAIIFIVLVDVIMATYQENKANTTAESLEKLVKEKTKVIRDKTLYKIDSSNLTVGDLVVLESGDKISADIRIIESHNLLVDESILTGESIQVSKTEDIINKENISVSERTNMLYAGTSVVTGRCKGYVCKIGLDTEIGKIAHSINKTEDEKSPLTIRVEKFSKQISILVLVIAVFLTVLLIVKDVPYHDIFLSVIALAVSAMPEGLPLALTMALTIASNKMLKKHVVVRKLNSVESLGSCTVIASDKTGTLTVNCQTAKKIVLPNGLTYDITGTGYETVGEVIGENSSLAKELSFLGVINNEASIDNKKYVGDSIDIAFKVLGKKLNIKEDIKILEIIPYESENKYSAVFYEKDGEVYCTVKGSLEVVKDFCSNINLTKKKISSKFLEKQNEELAKDGYRVITLANGKVEKKKKYCYHDIKDLTFMGMVGFIDPIRKEAKTSIEECKNAGINVLMITGDHPLTAFSIAKELNLISDFNEVATGIEIDEVLKKGKKSFDKFISKKKVFARVTPLQKFEIVESLKRMGEFVAVTGDGVNDAPALKSASIGIAMGSGTDIAREVSDMIIMDDNFTSIVSGIKEGRVAYSNIRKIIFFLISCGLTEVLFFTLSIIFDLTIPLLAIQLLWINVVTDGIQDFALSFEKAEKNIMNEKPRSPKEPLFDKTLLGEILVAGLTSSILVFLVWYYLIKIIGMDVTLARGYILALMVFIQNVHVFNCRSEKKSAFSVSLKSNKLIVVGVLASIILQVVVMEVPVLSKFLQTSSVPMILLICLFILSLFVLFVMEIYKEIRYKKLKSN